MVFSSSSRRHSSADTASESTLLQYKDVRPQLRDRGFPADPFQLNYLVVVVFFSRELVLIVGKCQHIGPIV